MKIEKKLISCVLVILLGILVAGCTGDSAENVEHANKKISFVLDWTPNTNHTGVYVALEKGYYKEAGLDVEVIQPPEDGAISAVGSGQAQFGVSFQENLGEALSKENPAPVTAVATIIDHNTSGIISLQEKGIEDFKSLEGKTYATWGLPVEQEILKYAVESSGGDFSKVKMVPHSGADAVSLLKSGTVDAVWVYEAWDNVSADLDGLIYNYVPFVQSDPILDWYTPVIIGNNDFLKNNEDTAKAFMEATAKGYEDAISNPQEAAEILLKAVPELDKNLVVESQAILAKYYKAEKNKWGTINVDRWVPFFDFMYTKNLIDKELKDFGFSNDYLPQ